MAPSLTPDAATAVEASPEPVCVPVDPATPQRRAKSDRKTGKAVAKVTASVSGDTLGAQFAYRSSKLDPLPEIFALPGGHAAIDAFRSAVGYEWPCEAAATETDTMPEPGAEANGRGLPADTVAALLAAKVDRKATYKQVEKMIERLYANEQYADALAGLTDYTGGGIFDERQMLYWLDQCQKKKDTPQLTRQWACGSALLDYLSAAQQLRGASDDPNAAAASEAIMGIAQALRSAAVNDGVSRKGIDTSLPPDALEFGVE